MAEDIEQVMRALYRALTERDEVAMARLLADDPRARHVFATDEAWRGYDTILTWLRRYFSEAEVRWEPSGERVLWCEGSMASVVDRPTLHFDDGSALRAHLSLVLVSIEGEWRVAHSHFSPR